MKHKNSNFCLCENVILVDLGWVIPLIAVVHSGFCRYLSCFCFSVECHSVILSENQVKTLFALVEFARNFSLCGRYENPFEDDDYQACLSRSNSFTVLQEVDESFIIGAFNDLNRTKSFGFDCSNSGNCTKLSTTMDPICIENNPDGNSVSRDCNDDKDLILKNFNGSALKHRFRPLWPSQDYSVKKVEIINVN